MPKIWTITLLFTPLLLLSQTTHQEWFQIADSEINIQGTSNVTDYTCFLHDLSNNSDLQIKSTRKDLLIQLENAVIELKSDGFNCNNGPMTSDFLKTIKAEEYPQIYIEFLSFKLNHSVTEKSFQDNVTAKIAVTLAGVRKEYSFKLDSLLIAMDSITTKGKKEISMADFNIEPPSALLGLVKADDLVTIDFRIVFNLK